MARPTRETRTLFEVLVARAAGGAAASSFVAGLKAIPQATKVQTYIVQWAMASREAGRVATTVEYADYWAKSERQAWRDRAAIHDLFPDDEFPRVIEAVWRALESGASTADVAGLRLAELGA